MNLRTWREMIDTSTPEDRRKHTWAEALKKAVEAEIAEMVPGTPLSGVGLIAFERMRQVNREGRTAEHDKEHDAGELAFAAAALATRHTAASVLANGSQRLENVWDWHCCLAAGKSKVRDLAKAGALIAAELDRVLATETAAIVAEGESHD